MKKVLIVLAIIGLVFIMHSGFAQAPKQKQPAPPPTTPAKKDTGKKYNYFALVPIEDWKNIAGVLQEYNRLQMYDPIPSDKQKVEAYRNIELYLKNLPA